ncbi:hypothetical protein [Phycisphaera mikurensis]|uniref:Uncharacterized protein n=1 Tax=Phycisphaera mikurensis (strain NBRC 102666 / KCTC 22515 / FYK2301M01) TaxID=1142394 RepID=I0ID77_PHYMF|nr:hypothetical protein [Phycisphaera mikurensis]MBB6442341.1 hypothetical protein [Phycisphaera mikurensis]BAM03215.1 hypothetical protein PSMK_10560 [Phycisphaera mikurensis NBRC 102666]
MNPFAPTAAERRGRKRTLFGLVLLLLAAATLAATAWPAVDGLGWPAWAGGAGGAGGEAADRGAGAAETAAVRGSGSGGWGWGWWCSVLRLHLGLLAFVLLLPALATKRLLSASLAGLALAANLLVVAAVPVRGGWPAAAEALWSGPPEAATWTVLHAHLAGADRLDDLASEVARLEPDAVTAAGARPGVAQTVTPLLDGYRLAGSRPAAGDDGLAVWVRRDVKSGAARPDGPAALAADLERGDDRLRLVVSTGPPPPRPEGVDAPILAVGGFGLAPWSVVAADRKLRLLPPGHVRPWPPPLDHAWADLPAGWSATATAGPAIDDEPFALHRPLRVRLAEPR